MGEPAEVIEDNYEEELEKAWEEHNKAPEEPVEEPPEDPAEDPEDPPEDPEAKEEDPEPVDPPEEKLQPHQHWPGEVKEVFNTMTRGQQDAWVDRERQYENGFQQKAAELNNSKQVIDEFQGMIGPLVQDWQRQGFTPSQGLMKMVALEKDLRENPAQAILRLAGSTGVNLENEVKEQPYIDPATRQLQEQLRQQSEQMESFKREQQQAQQNQQLEARNSAYSQLQTFASTTDESGAPKYPYVNTKEVMEHMGESLRLGQVSNLHDAYEAAIGYLREHPFFKDSVKQQTTDTQAKVKKAKSAAKVVKGKPSADISTDSQDDAILNLLADAGFE